MIPISSENETFTHPKFEWQSCRCRRRVGVILCSSSLSIPTVNRIIPQHFGPCVVTSHSEHKNIPYMTQAKLVAYAYQVMLG